MRKALICFILSILYCGALMAQQQYEQLLHKKYAQRRDLLRQIQTNVAFSSPDSVQTFKEINKFRAFAQKNSDKELVLEADMWTACFFKNYRRDNGALVVGSIKNVINHAKAAGMRTTEARARALLANYYFVGQTYYRYKPQGYYEFAFEEYFELEKLIKNVPDEEFPDKMFFFKEIAEAYYYFADYSTAIAHLKKALAIKHGPANYPDVVNARNTLGLCYQNLGKLDSSDNVFSSMLDKTDPAYYGVWATIAMGNLGYNCYLRGEYAKAVPLLQADISAAESFHDWGLASGSLMTLIDIYFKRGQNSKAEKLLPSARLYVERAKQYKRYAALYPLMSKLNAEKGQPKLSAMYLDSAMYVKDSLAHRFNDMQLLRAAQKAEFEQHRIAIVKIASEKELKTLQRNSLVGFIILLALGAVYVYQNQRKKHREQKLMLDLELEHKEKELAAAASQLADFAGSISEKNKLIESLELQFGEDSDNEVLEQLRQLTIITEDGWERFRTLFNQVHGNYLQRLKEKLPGLTPAETRFMVLAKLQLSNNEMAGVLGVSPQNIRTIWYRLRKKLNLPQDDSLKNLAESI